MTQVRPSGSVAPPRPPYPHIHTLSKKADHERGSHHLFCKGERHGSGDTKAPLHDINRTSQTPEAWAMNPNPIVYHAPLLVISLSHNVHIEILPLTLHRLWSRPAQGRSAVPGGRAAGCCAWAAVSW